MDHQSALGNFGSPCDFEWKGQTYTLSFFTQSMKATLVKLMKQHALSETLQLVKDCPEGKDIFLKEFQANAEAGKYSWGSPFHLALQQTEIGAVFFTLALFHKYPKIKEADVLEILNDPEKSVELTEKIKLHAPKHPAGEKDPKGPVA